MAEGRLSRFNRENKVWIVWTFRLLVGATFVVSGLAKVIDEWGFVYKIEQYLSIWDMTMPRTIVLAGAIGLSGAEFVFGLLLLTGCYRRVVTWLLAATMAFMLPLTFYIMVADPVSDCGCFGDFIRLSNNATFFKNVVLSVAIAYLVIFNSKVKGVYLPYCQWLVAFISGLYAIVVALFGYNVQPLVDFRSYPVESNFSWVEKEADDVDVAYIYERDGERKSFSVNDLPDSTWTFVDRRLVGDVGDSGVFTIYDGDEDVTETVLHGNGEQLFLAIPDLRRADISYTYLINEINRYMTARGGELVGLLAADRQGINGWIDYSMAQYPCYTADDTSIKELVRGNVGLVYVKDGMIVWKRNLWSVPSDVLTLSSNPMASLDFDGTHRLLALTGSLLTAMLLLALLQTMALVLRCRVKLRRMRKGEKVKSGNPSVKQKE